jgi:hypothetical protein
VGTLYTMTSGTTTCTATVTWAADANYNGATLDQSTTATKIAPTTTFTGAPASAAFGSSFTVASTTNSSASPVYTASGGCSNVGTLYTMTSGTTTCTATVTWAADANYNGATLDQSTTATTGSDTTPPTIDSITNDFSASPRPPINNEDIFSCLGGGCSSGSSVKPCVRASDNIAYIEVHMFVDGLEVLWTNCSTIFTSALSPGIYELHAIAHDTSYHTSAEATRWFEIEGAAAAPQIDKIQDCLDPTTHKCPDSAYIDSNVLKDLRKHLSGINKEVTKAYSALASDKMKGFDELRHSIDKVNKEIHFIQDHCPPSSSDIPTSVCNTIIQLYQALRQQLVFKGLTDANSQCKGALTALNWTTSTVKDCASDSNVNTLLTSRCAGTTLNKAQKEFCKGLAQLQMGRADQICGYNAENSGDEATARAKYNSAIQHYKHAWKHFERTIKAASGWDPDSDSYYDTIDPTNEEDPNQVNP